MKITVYTCVFGSYDNPGNLTPKPDNVTLLCISDKKYDGWENITIKPPFVDPVYGPIKSNRFYKLQPWLVDDECDINIYVDGCIANINWKNLLDKCDYLWNNNLDAIFIKHPRLGGKTSPEISEIARQRKADLRQMVLQYTRYKEEGFQDNVHIIAANTQIRRTSSQILNNTLRTWWNEVNNGCHRDQISFGYAVWKNNFINYELITREERGKIFSYNPHSGSYSIG